MWALKILGEVISDTIKWLLIFVLMFGAIMTASTWLVLTGPVRYPETGGPKHEPPKHSVLVPIISGAVQDVDWDSAYFHKNRPLRI